MSSLGGNEVAFEKINGEDWFKKTKEHFSTRTAYLDFLKKWGDKPKIKERFRFYFQGFESSLFVSCSKGSNPDDVGIQINSTGEAAYQRVFFREGPTKLRLAPGEELEIKWLDLEVPVALLATSSNKRLDLIGQVGQDYLIAELKDSSNNENPFSAVSQVVRYALSIAKNNSRGRKLVSHKRFIVPEAKDIQIKDYWAQFKRVKYLIVAAPSKYWDTWQVRKYRSQFQDVIGWIMDEYGFRLIFAEFLDESFRDQQRFAGTKKYIPRLQNNKANVWKEV